MSWRGPSKALEWPERLLLKSPHQIKCFSGKPANGEVATAFQDGLHHVGPQWKR